MAAPPPRRPTGPSNSSSGSIRPTPGGARERPKLGLAVGIPKGNVSDEKLRFSGLRGGVGREGEREGGTCEMETS